MTSREVNRVGEGQKNIPKLRFKGYEDAWEQRKFSEIALRESTVQESSRDFPSVEYEDVIVEAGRLNKDVNQKEVVKKGIVFDGSQVLYGKLRPYLHNWLNPDFSGVAVGDWWVLKPIKVDKSFLYRLIQTQQFDDIANQSAGSKMPRADWNLVSNLEFAVPVAGDEQSKIGGYFSSLDTLITLHQRKYDALKTMKKTLLSKMFPKDGEDVPEIRFKEFTDAWEQRKLGEVSQIVGGGTPSTGIPEYWDGDIDWYSPVEIGEEIFVSCSQRKITQLGLEKSSAKILPVGTVLFTSRAGIGNTAILEKEGCTNQGFQSIVPKDNELDSYFIFSCSHLLKKYGETKGAGSTFAEISGKQMSLMPLNIPEIKEQKSVGNFFRKLDSIITLHQRKLDELKNMKKTLLQQMFV